MATIRVVKTDEEFLGLRDEWNSILAQQRSARAFQTFEWNYAGWLHYHRRHFPSSRLNIVVATREGHDDQRMILPLCIFPDGHLEFLMQMISDIVDAIVPDHSDNWNNFYSDVIDYLMKDPAVRGVSFIHLENRSEFVRYLQVYGADIEMRRMDSYSYLRVSRTDSFSRSLMHLTSKERSYVKSLLKKPLNGEYKLYSRKLGDAFPKNEIVQLRDWMCDHGLRVKSFFPDETVDFMECAYGMGLDCEISAVRGADGTFEEASFRLCHNGYVNFWVVLYKDTALTTLADCHYMDARSREGDVVFDFGTGAYKYKLGTYRPEVENLFSAQIRKRSFLGMLREITSVGLSYVRYWIKGR